MAINSLHLIKKFLQFGIRWVLKVIFCSLNRYGIRRKLIIRVYYNNIIFYCLIFFAAKSKNTIINIHSCVFKCCMKNWIRYNYFIECIIKWINMNTILKSFYYFFITWIFIKTFSGFLVKYFTIRRCYIIYIFNYCIINLLRTPITWYF